MGSSVPPKWLRYVAIFSVFASWIPLAVIALARTSTNDQPPLHLFYDMDVSQSYGAQETGPELEDGTALFADRRAARLPVAGTVARGELGLDAHYFDGRFGPGEEDFYSGMPKQIVMTRRLLERGQERFNIFCAPCHGASGYGTGMVSQRALALQEGTWVPPASFHDELIRSRPDGHIYNTITNGIRNMKGYGSQIPVEDRWAIVAYVRALQFSQHAPMDELPRDVYQSVLAGGER